MEGDFECQDPQFIPSKFKGVDVIQERPNIVLSQLAYLDTKGKTKQSGTSTTKLDLHRELTDNEAGKLRIAAGRLR